MSVLVPAYNAATTVGEALESALSQAPAPSEIIVSDDGSSDDLGHALKPFKNHIRLVQGPHAGLATARNRAATVARGELLALLDADDIWLPGRVEALRHAAAARPDVAVLTTDAFESRAGVMSPERYYQTRDFPVAAQDLAIMRSNFIFGAGAIRATAFRSVGGYRPDARYAEDWDLWIRMLLQGYQAGLIDLPLYEYRRHEGSLTGHVVELALGVSELLVFTRGLGLSPEQGRLLALTEQEWREEAARAAHRGSDPRARRLALRAATGGGATPRARLRFGAAALLPARMIAAGRSRR